MRSFLFAVAVACVLAPNVEAGLFQGCKARTAARRACTSQHQSYRTIQYRATYSVASVVPIAPTGQNTGPIRQVAQVPSAVPIAGTIATGADAYGFTAWLNGVRAQYGLPAVGYDPNLESWAAMNSAQQATSGIGHFVMGPARRQNSAMGGFPGIESMWMASPAHRAALLDPSIQWIGISCVGAYWTFNAY